MCGLLSHFWDSSAPLLIEGLYVAYYVATAVALLQGWRYAKRAYRTNWFEGSTEKLSWNRVKVLMTADPLDDSKPHLGRPQVWRDLPILGLALSIWFVGVLGLGALAKDHSKDNVEVATFLVGFLGLAGAATKVTYEWRLKARSENRQRWIDQIRETLSALIANIPLPSDFPNERDRKAKVYLEQHGKLELLLNPSEKDHRALMALIRHIYGHDRVPIDDIPRKELGFATLSPSNPADRTALKSQMIRLSNVVLKREWERVKRIQ
jgi:hypothetical protein